MLVKEDLGDAFAELLLLLAPLSLVPLLLLVKKLFPEVLLRGLRSRFCDNDKCRLRLVPLIGLLLSPSGLRLLCEPVEDVSDIRGGYTEAIELYSDEGEVKVEVALVTSGLAAELDPNLPLKEPPDKRYPYRPILEMRLSLLLLFPLP